MNRREWSTGVPVCYFYTSLQEVKAWQTEKTNHLSMANVAPATEFSLLLNMNTCFFSLILVSYFSSGRSYFSHKSSLIKSFTIWYFHEFDCCHFFSYIYIYMHSSHFNHRTLIEHLLYTIEQKKGKEAKISVQWFIKSLYSSNVQ